jgi:hypothetical protein
MMLAAYFEENGQPQPEPKILKTIHVACTDGWAYHKWKGKGPNGVCGRCGKLWKEVNKIANRAKRAKTLDKFLSSL